MSDDFGLMEMGINEAEFLKYGMELRSAEPLNSHISFCNDHCGYLYGKKARTIKYCDG